MPFLSPHRARRALLAAISFAALAVPSPALAHPTLVSSSPASGAILPLSPTELRLVFSKSVQADLSSVTLSGPAIQAAVVLPAPAQPAGFGKVLVTRVLRALPPGIYVVGWRAAGNDGHAVKGSFSFTIAGPRPAP
jgi:methionine-rich copper-binding protein CopC